MKKSINIEKIFLEKDFYERFYEVRKCGFEYAEFWTWPSRDIDRIVDCCFEAGVKISCISGDKDYSLIVNEERQAYLDYLMKSIEVAKRLGTKHLVIHSNAMDGPKILNDGSKISLINKIASMIRTLEEAAKMAEQYNIILVIEALNNITVPGYFLTKTADAGDICRIIGSSNLKLLYDTWHMQLMEGNIISNITSYFDVLGYIHVGDAPERHEPGTGEINFFRVKKTLNQLGYDGFLGFELVPSQNSYIACERIKNL